MKLVATCFGQTVTPEEGLLRFGLVGNVPAQSCSAAARRQLKTHVLMSGVDFPIFRDFPKKGTTNSKFSTVCFMQAPENFENQTHSYGFFHEKRDPCFGIS